MNPGGWEVFETSHVSFISRLDGILVPFKSNCFTNAEIYINICEKH